MFIHWKLFFAIENYLKENRDSRALQTDNYSFFCPYVNLFLLFASFCFVLFVCMFIFLFTCCSVSEKGAGQFSRAQHN